MSGRGLRIIAGEHRGRRIRTIECPGTRPMTDRVRENLFNILAPELPGAAFLDLFAGSGAVGIEALSRGAGSAVFVERDRRWSGIIGENVATLGLEQRAEILTADAYTAIQRFGEIERIFDIIFIGAPYGEDHHNRAAAAVLNARVCAPEGTLVLQYRSGDRLDPLGGLAVDTRVYGVTALTILRRRP